jgi:hypothetical protein
MESGNLTAAGWQFLAEITYSDPSDPELSPGLLIAGTIQALSLPGGFLKRLETAINRTVHQSDGPIMVRILISQPYRPGQPDNPGAVDPERKTGWGFFLLGKSANPEPAAKIEPRQVLEVYLYPELDPSAAVSS